MNLGYDDNVAGPSKSLIGRVIDGRYEVLEQIAVGGVGIVYKAKRLKLERIVALKVLHDALLQQPGFVKRFQTEAVALSRLDHPHCVAVLDIGFHEGRPYMVLEYVPGQTVSQLLDKGRIDPRRAVTIALQVLDTLEHFHQQHIVHRDLKAENVMLLQSAKTADFVKVLDFGMAKILQGRGRDSNLSNIGVVPGTPSAMAPEQIRQLPPDPRIDIYATGIMLYEMVVGHRPFRGADHAEIVNMQLKEPPKPPREVLGDGVISNALDALILKALEKNRFDRFASAADMAAALRTAPEAPAVPMAGFDVTAMEPSRAEEAAHGALLMPRQPARWKWIAGAVGALGVLIAIAVWPKSKGSLEESIESVAPADPVAEPAPAPVPAPKPVPSEAPTPTPAAAVAEPWRVHRDLALTYAGQGLDRQAFLEVLTALRDDPAKAAADDALLEVAMTWLTLPEGKEYAAKIAESFKPNPHLVDSLVQAYGRDWKAAKRNAYTALAAIGEQGRVDGAEVLLLELKDAKGCPGVRWIVRELADQGKSEDPRVKSALKSLRGSQAKCLRSRRSSKRR